MKSYEKIWSYSLDVSNSNFIYINIICCNEENNERIIINEVIIIKYNLRTYIE